MHLPETWSLSGSLPASIPEVSSVLSQHQPCLPPYRREAEAVSLHLSNSSKTYSLLGGPKLPSPGGSRCHPVSLPPTILHTAAQRLLSPRHPGLWLSFVEVIPACLLPTCSSPTPILGGPRADLPGLLTGHSDPSRRFHSLRQCPGLLRPALPEPPRTAPRMASGSSFWHP